MYRLLELDAIRGLAALSIVLFHYASAYKWTISHPYYYFHYLEECVQVFFIISGFLILISIKRTKRSLDFITSRFSRLYPIYLFSVISTILITNVARIIEPRTEKTYDIILNFFMLQDFLGAKSVNIVYWTLTLEIAFYIIILIIYKFKLVKHIEAICSVWIVIILLDVLKNYMHPDNVFTLPFSTNQMDMIAFANLPSNTIGFFKDFIKANFLLLQGRAVLFIAGILIYQIETIGFSLYRLALIILCILVKFLNYNPDIPKYSSIFFIVFLIIIYLAINKKLKILSIKPLTFLGTISYSLYLIHLQVNWLISPLFIGFPPEVSIIIKTLIAIAIASLLTWSIELPAMNLIKLQYKKIIG